MNLICGRATLLNHRTQSIPILLLTKLICLGKPNEPFYSVSKPTTRPPSTVAFTLIGLQQFLQSDTKSSSPCIPSSMTRVSEVQKGQEIVVVLSNGLFPFSFQFFTRLASVFAGDQLSGIRFATMRTLFCPR